MPRTVYSERHKPIILVSDPAENGAFPSGAEFTSDEVREMLRYDSFTDGTVLEITCLIRNQKFRDAGFDGPGLYVIRGGKAERIDDE
jgi:hypothetical protein